MNLIEQKNRIFLNDECVLNFTNENSKISSSEIKIFQKETNSDKLFKYSFFLLSGIVTLFSWSAIITQTTVFFQFLKVFSIKS